MVSPVAKSASVAKPGSVVTVAIKVVNKTSESQMYDATVDLPSGWRQVIREDPFQITADDIAIRLIIISVPSDAPASDYTIRYKVRDRAKVVHEASASINVVVPQIIHLELDLFQAPRFVVAKTKFLTEFLLKNQGNSASAIRLSYRSSHDYPVRVDSTIVHLEPKEVRRIQLSVTPDALSETINHTLELEAISMLDTTIRVRISSVVEIIQPTTKVGEAYLLFPVSLRLREFWQEGKFFTQGELYGSGSLNERGTDQFEFLFRAPETQSVSTLGLRDEYRISYSTDSLKLYAGDQNYSLSPLTEVGRFATGIGGNTVMGKFSAGGFYNETRWTTPSQKEAGGFFNYKIKQGASIGINYLSKREQFSSDIATIRGLFIPLSGSNLDVELGTGKKDDKSDNAVAARFEGIRKPITYDLRYIQAGPNFGGYYQDMNFFSASINAQVMRDLRIQSAMRLENGNISRDTNLVNAPHESYYQVGAGYSDYISVSYRYIGREDRFDSVKYRNREDAIQARVGVNFSIVTMYANMDIGTSQDELNIREMPFRRFSLYLSFRPGTKQNFSTTLEYETIRDTVSGKNHERLSANFNAWILFGRSTQVQLSLFGNRLMTSPAQINSIIEASIEHVFAVNHKLTLRGRLSINSPSTTANEVVYALEYALPIAIPFKRITGVGQLRGFLRDEEGRGIANVLLNIGEEFVLSDGHGAFYFSSLKPGTVYLIVDKATLGFDKITSQPIPMEMLIRGGEESKITLFVTRRVTISGSVILFAAKQQNILDTSTALIEVGGKSGVFLELSSSAEVQRRVSDNRGKFLFEDLRPGAWVLKVTGGDIPEYHIIDPDTINIKVTPGDKKDVTIQIRPSKRTIKILQEGTVIQ